LQSLRACVHAQGHQSQRPPGALSASGEPHSCACTPVHLCGDCAAQTADPRQVEEPREDATLAELAAQLADCTDDLVLLYSYAAPPAQA